MQNEIRQLKNKEQIMLMTPVVEVRWAFLDKPDTKYNSAGDYKADLVFDINVPEQKQFLTTLKHLLPKDSNTFPWKKDSTDTNKYVVRVKQKAVVNQGGKNFEFKPRFFDVNAQPIADVPQVGNGSKLAFNIEIRGYVGVAGKTGIRLNPHECQLVELVAYQSGGTSFTPAKQPPLNQEQLNQSIQSFQSEPAPFGVKSEPNNFNSQGDF